LYIFEGVNRFVGLIEKMRQRLNELAQAEEEKLTLQLAARFEDKATGIGFVPTTVKLGDVVILPTMGFSKLQFQGDEYYIGNERQILAKITDENE
jgi:co-chaperonin GroES (HSP10)